MLDRYCLYLKIYGERNSGTNFVQKLVQANFAVHCLQSNNRVYDYINLLSKRMPKATRGEFRSSVVDIDCRRTITSDFGWKHGIPPMEAIAAAPHTGLTLFVCIAKHPLAWLRSLLERPYNPVDKLPDDFSQFIRHPWVLTERDNLPGQPSMNVVDLWNVKNAAYRELQAKVPHCRVYSYEQILYDPRAFLSDLEANLLAKRDEFIWSFPSTKGDEMTLEEYRKKYQTAEVFQGIAEADLEFIASRLDAGLLRSFGYAWN